MKLATCVLCLMGLNFMASASEPVKMEIGVSGVIAISSNKDDSPNLYGGLINGGVLIQEHHRLGLNIGVLAGSIDETFQEAGVKFSDSVDITSVPIIASYDYIFKVSPKVELYAGLRGGVLINNYDMSAEIRLPNEIWSGKGKDSEIEPMMGFGLGARFVMSPKSSFYVGYELWKVYASNPLAKAMELPSEDLNPTYHVIKAGYSYAF